ncbi:MAG: hypothetical protein LBR38_09680, partial [Synergistaceae bacterium]|nr:hypothetical protein [Synergistaceae bacterium]
MAPAALVLTLLILGSEAFAAVSEYPLKTGDGYQFDNVYGPSGIGAQWMVIVGETEYTGGDEVNTDVKIGGVGNIVNGRYPVRIDNLGRWGELMPPNPVVAPYVNGEGWPILAMFLVMPEQHSKMRIRFVYLPKPLADEEVVTPGVDVANDEYTRVVTALLDQPTNLETPLTPIFEISLDKRPEFRGYGSSRGDFIFTQNPDQRPS